MGLLTAAQYRRELHQIPELGLSLPRTQAYIRSALAGLPCQLSEPIPSAVCAYFDLGKPDTLAFRADMDALPITENAACPFPSRHAGRMHACGHDAHMGILLEFAHKIPELRLNHNILLIFQPGEETTGGAKPICDTGILARCRVSAVFGLHLWPDLPGGVIASRPGGMMCRSCEVTLEVTGRSAHVAKAEEGLDALAAAAQWYTAAMQLAAQIPEEDFHLLKFGRFTAGTVRNALAGSARVEGTLRAVQEETFRQLRAQLDALTAEVAAGSGCALKLACSEGYPAVSNDAALLARVEKIAPVARLAQPTRITEDFSWYQQSVPGVFFFLGCGPASALHSDDFDFDESVLAAGVRLWCLLAEGL
ncbi:MAG: amidohydrolase [Firmicutes bacterium]|nr:amidohydrolase [Bacillota bacterium]